MSIWPTRTDVPSREAPVSYPEIQLYNYRFPLNPEAQKELTATIGMIPALIQSSKTDDRHRIAPRVWHAPGNVELSTLAQAESARPFTITTADNSRRISVNGVPTSLDQFRGTPYIQADLRISRPIRIGERWLILIAKG